MSLSRKNHYIPQMYLDAWANNGLIRVYDLLVADEKMPVWSKPKQLSSIGYMKNLYINVRRRRMAMQFYILGQLWEKDTGYTALSTF